MNFRNVFSGAMVAFCFSCTSVPLTSIPSLKKIDFTTTDIAYARVAIKYPEVINFNNSPVQLHAKYRPDGKAREVRAVLTNGAKDFDDLEIIKSLKEPDMRVDILRVPDDKVSEFAKFCQEVIVYKETGKPANGEFGFWYGGACLKSITDEPLIAQVYIKTTETGQYIQALRNVDLREEAIKAGVAQIPLCN